MGDDKLMDDELPTPEQWERLQREWRGNATHRPLWEKGVRYENEYDRVLDELIERGKSRQQSRERDQGHER